MSGVKRLRSCSRVPRVSLAVAFLFAATLALAAVDPRARAGSGSSRSGSRAVQAAGVAPSPGIVGFYPEFERVSALVFGFSELIRFHSQTLVDIVGALNGEIPIVGVVADEHQRREVLTLLEQAGISSRNLELVQVPVVGMWMRDYGPTFVRRVDGQFMVLDAQYVRLNHEPDDSIPRYLAGYFRLPVVDIPLRLDGGNVLGNGEGLVFTTDQAITENAGYGYDEKGVARVLHQLYGATDWHVVKPLAGEPTGHIDIFLTLVAPDVAVLGAFDPEEDPVNARHLDDVAVQLARASTRSGRMRVVRIPMPSHEDGLWRSYTNVIFANDTLLVPAYPDVSPELDENALAIYSELLPGRRIVPIDATTMVRRNGTLHCISVHVPVFQ